MKRYCNVWLTLASLALLALPAVAAVTLTGFSPSPASPQQIGTAITWTATATDTGSGPLTFQFKVAPPGSNNFVIVRDFNAGNLSGGTWTSQPFVWVPTGIEGVYKIQVNVKDFSTGQSTTHNTMFMVTPLAGSMPVVVPTGNPLVALFSSPSCASGSAMRVMFQDSAMKHKAMATNFVACHPPNSMTFEVAGMYPSTAYTMFSQTKTGTTLTNGPSVSFTTGALPGNINFPPFKVLTRPGSHTDTAAPVIMDSLIQNAIPYLGVATDLAGNIIWYYYQPNTSSHYALLTRPLTNGGALTIQDGQGWNPATTWQQTIRQIDLAGNIVRETNIGVLQQQLLAMGATDAAPCESIPSPAPVGSACMGGFHHEAVQLSNGSIALIADIEKIFPAGTQGDTSGLPVDIVGDMIIILNPSTWQATWYWDAFQHDGGAPQLDINRTAVLAETCTINQNGCPPMLLLGSGIAPNAHDWLHANSVYLWAKDNYGGANNDLLLSLRHQDYVLKIDYNNGAGTGNVLWRLGPCGDFTFNNVNNDPWPWFSHQHEVAVENNNAGPISIMDNGNTRVSFPSSSTGCIAGVGSGNSRGMALTLNESTMTATPVLSQDLGVFSTAMGSAQFLSNKDYYFFLGIVFINLTTFNGYSQDIYPTAGTVNGTNVLNIQGMEGYRGWQMPSLYTPPKN
jgi:arylsulfate sulfotransferase